MLRFGTDGIRGRANVELTMETGYWFGVALSTVLKVPQVALGRDTRASGLWLSRAVGLGLASAGVDVIDLGILPTGAISWCSRRFDIPSVVVSASHNPFFDNGIKVFQVDGAKVDESIERAIELKLAAYLDGLRPSFGELGHLVERSVSAEYLSWLVGLHGTLPKPVRVVVDGAHGAAASISLALLEALGAEVVGSVGVSPDGTNINAGVGALHPERVAELVVAMKADIGLAFDGDADRLIAATADGEVADGDDIIAVLAYDLLERRALQGRGVVLTVMANLGLERSLVARGVTVVRTGVGDRQVADAMRAYGFGLGGEQSGHVIVSDHSPTGDGLVTATLLLHAIARSGVGFGGLVSGAFHRFPQVQRSVATAHGLEVVDDPRVVEAVSLGTRELGDSGRIVLRPSGTEPLVRVMVEASERFMADRIAQELVAVVRRVAD
ncbi:MAG: phosphohexomutase domain-containing protein [Ferrimicrobium sp.]